MAHFHVVEFIDGCLNDYNSGPHETLESAREELYNTVRNQNAAYEQRDDGENAVYVPAGEDRYTRGLYIFKIEPCREASCVTDGDPQAACDACDDTGHAGTDPGPNQGCWDSAMYCDCPAGVQAKLREESNSLDDADMTPAQRAAWNYDAYRHDPDSIGFDNSYTGPSELVLGGGCDRCGCPDDCLCDG